MFAISNISLPQKLQRAVDKRQAEFLAGRLLARQALADCAILNGAVGLGKDRAPVWPIGAAGSISHTKGLCMVIAAASSEQEIGLDVERFAQGSTVDAIRHVALSDTECQLIQQQDQLAPDVLATLVFSAKECLYKALYPTVKRFFGFDAAEITAPPESTYVMLRLTQDLSPQHSKGAVYPIRYQCAQDHLWTWLIRPKPASSDLGAQ